MGILELMKERRIYFDGGMGSLLQARGLKPGELPETWNLSRQEMAVGLAFSDVILKGRGVSRVHGGGFAGTIQAFVPNDIVDIYKKNMEDIFGQDACHELKIRKYGGMKVL